MPELRQYERVLVGGVHNNDRWGAALEPP
jgi:hypothetical protein